MATCCQLSSLWLSSLLIQFWWWLMAPLIHCLCCDRHHIMVLFADHSWACIFVNSVLKKILITFNMSLLRTARQRSHRETLSFYFPHHRWASGPLREAEDLSFYIMQGHWIKCSSSFLMLGTCQGSHYNIFLVCAAIQLIILFSLASSKLNFFVLRSRKDSLGFSKGWFVGAFFWFGFFPLF